MSIKVAILASGSGSNAENIIKYFKDNHSIKVNLVLSNKKDAYVLQRAQRLNIPFSTFTKKELEETDKVLLLLQEYKIDFIVLAGFLLRIPDNLLHTFPNKIINIHPALLPNYGGKGMYGDRVHEAVVAAGETKSGITIHCVDEHYDAGSIIFQATCPVLPTDTALDVAQKVHALEYEHFPRVIEETIKKEFWL